MKTYGLVLARGSSKSIANKNSKSLVNKPLIGWALEPMISSNIFDEIWVSTDEEQIASIALAYNVKVHRRSEQSASDSATSLSAIQEFLDSIKDFIFNVDQVCLVQCTSPCLLPSFLKCAHKLMSEEEYDSVFSVYRSHSLRWSLDLKPLNFDPKARPRRQDWNGEYIESGHFYWFRAQLVRQNGVIQGGKCGVVEIPQQNCIEIDNEFDWDLAEILVNRMCV